MLKLMQKGFPKIEALAEFLWMLEQLIGE